jgi:hypothetical protein
MKRATMILATLALAGAVALGGESSKLTPAVYREISGKVEEMRADPRKAKAVSAEVGKLVDAHRAELLSALKDGAALERALAATVLHLGTGEKDKVAAALAAALKDQDADVRRGAAAGLAQMKVPATAPAMAAALEDLDETVRALAAGALGELKAAEAKPALAKALADESWKVRLAACRALAALADKDSSLEIAGRIKPLLEDENAYVRMAAAAAVQKLAGTAPEGAPGGGKKDENILQELAKDMYGVKEKLDREHHGQEVLVAEEGIAGKLDQLIKMIQEQQQQQQQQSQGQGKPKEGEKKPGQGQGSKPGNQGGQGKQGGQNPSSPMQGEFMTGGSTQHGEKAQVGDVGADWGKLPPKERDKMLQAAQADLPARYRSMLEVYLRAISEESGK